MIEQITAILAGILAKRKAGDDAGALEEIERKCLEHVGLPMIVVRQSTPEALVALLEAGGALRIPRSVILAELLWEDARISETRGNPVSAAGSYASAERLLLGVLPFLGADDRAACEEKLEAIAAKRRDLG